MICICGHGELTHTLRCHISGCKCKDFRPKLTCGHCGTIFEGSMFSLLSDEIQKHKPVCSYACNKALGQVI